MSSPLRPKVKGYELLEGCRAFADLAQFLAETARDTRPEVAERLARGAAQIREKVDAFDEIYWSTIRAN